MRDAKRGWLWEGTLAAAFFALGLWLFASGFLSVRTELTDVASCDPANACSVEPTFQKAVVIIVDAVREDFYFAGRSAEDASPVNDLLKLRQLVQSAGHAALAARFTADVPTITISRLKAWLTGCLPTFLDIGQSFSAVSLGEDNLLSKLAAHGKRTVFMGDDTWMQLAPAGVFTASHPYPSFNVLDMHTVDDGVWKHLQQYLHAPSAWDVLIAHYLGVDHAGHAHGVGSAAMAAKVAQMDDQLVAVAEALVGAAGPGGAHEDTLLLIMSDHGQTHGGDHGGSSYDEVNTLLVAVNLHAWWQVLHASNATAAASPLVPTGAVPADTSSAQTVLPGHTHPAATGAVEGSRGMADAALLATHTNPPWTERGGQSSHDALSLTLQPGARPAPPRAAPATTISQLDFTATFAALMGIPVPYSNLGSVDPSLWEAMTATHAQHSGPQPDASAHADNRERYLEALLLTCKQVHGYLQHYVRVASLPAKQLQATLQLYEHAIAYARLLRDTPAQSTSATHAHPRSQSSPASSDTRLNVPGGRAERMEGVEESAEAHATERHGRAGLEEAVAACSAFLGSAAALARRQFTGCNLPRMVAGSVALLLAILQLLIMVAKQLDLADERAPDQDTSSTGQVVEAVAVLSRPSGQSIVKSKEASILPASSKVPQRQHRGQSLHTMLALAAQPHVLGPLAVCVFQSCSLFGLTWMMAEGRVQCLCAAACIAALGVTAAHQALSHGKQQAQLALGSTRTPRQPPAKVSRAGSMQAHGWSGVGTAAWACIMACMGVGSVVVLARWGLMDRASSDPHDKAAQSTTLEDLLGIPTQPLSHSSPADASHASTHDTLNSAATGALSTWEGLITLGPLLLMPWLAWGLHVLLSRKVATLHTWAMQDNQMHPTAAHAGTHPNTLGGTAAQGEVAAVGRAHNGTLTAGTGRRPLAGDQPDSAVQRLQAAPEATASRSEILTHRLVLLFSQYLCCTMWWLLQLLGSQHSAATPQQTLQQLTRIVNTTLLAHWYPTQPQAATAASSQLNSSWEPTAADTSAFIVAAAALAPLATLGGLAMQQARRHQPVWNRIPAWIWVALIALLAYVIHAHGNGFGRAVNGAAQTPSFRLPAVLRDSLPAVLELAQLVLAVPYRLLLPRCVYLLSAMGLGWEVAASLFRHLRIVTWSRTERQTHWQGALTGYWLAAFLWPPVTLLLGRRGPVCMACAALTLTSCLGLISLLAATTRASEAQHTRTPSGHPADEPTLGASFNANHGITPLAPHSAVPNGLSASHTPIDSSTTNTASCDTAISASFVASLTPAHPACPAAAMRRATTACIGGALSLHAISSALFFATGHFCEFTGLQYASPFIGFDDMQWWISPILLSLNTFGAMLAAALPLALIPIVSFASSLDSTEAARGHPDASDTSLVAERVTNGHSTPGRTEPPDAQMENSGRPEVKDCDAQPRMTRNPIESVHALAGSASVQKGVFLGLRHEGVRQGLRRLRVVTLGTFVAARCWTTCMLMLCSVVLHDGILAWAIIAPRVVFELFFQVICLCVVVLCCLPM